MFNPTLVAWDYLIGLPNGKCYSLPINDVCTELRRASEENAYHSYYYRGDSILKTSVGEFYDENMQFFLETAASLIAPLEDFFVKKSSDIDRRVVGVIQKLLPLGYTGFPKEPPPGCFIFLPVSELGLHRYLDSDGPYIIGGVNHVLPEVREYMKEVMTSHTGHISEYYKNQQERVEALGHSLSAGFTPREGVPKVISVINDTGCLEDAILANIMYPWVMQPLTQLRMLVTSLPKEIRTNIIEGYLGDRPIPAVAPGNSLDIGYAFTFDILADFLTYNDFLYERPSYFQRQFWTPWLGFDFPSQLVGFDDKYMDKIKECAARSNKLYLEILKTGLRYEAQYSVLAGFRGRFCVAGNLGSVAAVSETLSNSGYSPLTRAVSKDIVTNIKNRISFADGLFKFMEESDGAASSKHGPSAEGDSEREGPTDVEEPPEGNAD
jgi:hypothetical protein